jgi:hypothetical protein
LQIWIFSVWPSLYGLMRTFCGVTVLLVRSDLLAGMEVTGRLWNITCATTRFRAVGVRANWNAASEWSPVKGVRRLLMLVPFVLESSPRKL